MPYQSDEAEKVDSTLDLWKKCIIIAVYDVPPTPCDSPCTQRHAVLRRKEEMHIEIGIGEMQLPFEEIICGREIHYGYGFPKWRFFWDGRRLLEGSTPKEMNWKYGHTYYVEVYKPQVDRRHYEEGGGSESTIDWAKMRRGSHQ